MRLVSLGFFRDECSDTKTFYRSIAEVNKYMMANQKSEDADDGSSSAVLKFLVVLLAIFGALNIVYCCLKHRSKVCPCIKQDKGDHSQLGQDS